MYTTIHYVRAVEAQKSLSRVQRIKNKLRNFGKKKTEPKDKKRPLTEPLIIDVEMIDAEQNCELYFNHTRMRLNPKSVGFNYFVD